MKVSELIEALEKCDPDVDVEIRGTVEEGYLCTKDIAVDDNTTWVILDI